MKRFLGIWLFCIVIFSCGCKERVFPNTDCYVYGVRDNLYQVGMVCSYNDSYYYYSDGAIYCYEDGKELLLVDDLKSYVYYMVCNGEYLYYELYSENKIYCFNLLTNKLETIEVGEQCLRKYFWGQNVSLLMYEDEQYNLYNLSGTEKKLIYQIGEAGEEGKSLFASHEDYVFYFVYEKNKWNIRNIHKNDGTQYAFSDIWINDKYLSINNVDYEYNEKEYHMDDIIEKNEGGAATISYQNNLFNGKVYMLYQYGLRAAGGKANPVATDKRYNDSIYSLDPETGEVELVYKTEDPTIQIAGFSIEDDVLYLLKNDGLYRCNMKGEQEEFILENKYESMSFEDCNGKLFVFDGDSTYESELIAVVE